MHKHFSDWYREIGIVPTTEALDKRRAAIEAIVKDIKRKEVIALVCILNHGGQCLPEFAEQFAQHFLKSDTTFSMRNNENELRVLAGACLAEIIISRTDLALIAAACIISGAFAIPSSEPPFVDVKQEAEAKMARASSDLRAEIQYPEIPLYGPELEAVLQKFKTQTTPNNLQQVQLVTPLIDGLVKTEKMLIELAQKSREFVTQAQCRIETLAEECNVLWWLFSGHSHDLEIVFTLLDKKALPIILGKELADLIAYLPGPTSVKAILNKAMLVPQKGKGNSQYKISDAVNSLSLAWRTSIAEKVRANAPLFPCIFPLHSAIALAVDLDGSEWDKALKKKVSYMEVDLLIPTSQIAYQFYLESLMMKVIDVKE